MKCRWILTESNIQKGEILHCVEKGQMGKFQEKSSGKGKLKKDWKEIEKRLKR